MNDQIKAGLWTALFTFIGLFLLASLGWLADIAAWASSSGQTPLPGLGVLGYAAVSAAVAAVVGLINTVIRWLQARGVLPGNGPAYPPS
jgi:hypothetical protein